MNPKSANTGPPISAANAAIVPSRDPRECGIPLDMFDTSIVIAQYPKRHRLVGHVYGTFRRPVDVAARGPAYNFAPCSGVQSYMDTRPRGVTVRVMSGASTGLGQPPVGNEAGGIERERGARPEAVSSIRDWFSAEGATVAGSMVAVEYL
jgi:hypothetical protein